MALVNQSFNLLKNYGNVYKSKQEYEHLKTYEGFDEFASNYQGNDVYGAYDRALKSGNKSYQGSITKATKSTVALALAVGAFAYNYTAATTRFGLRGQDIQDQLKIQDKMVNKAFGIAGATLGGLMMGGPWGAVAGLVMSTTATIVNEVVSVSIQNKAYEYRKSIDEQQKSIMQERIGRAVYNSSRRA